MQAREGIPWMRFCDPLEPLLLNNRWPVLHLQGTPAALRWLDDVGGHVLSTSQWGSELLHRRVDPPKSARSAKLSTQVAKFLKPKNQIICVALQRAFPDDRHLPALSRK